MRWKDVHIESVAYLLPARVLTSLELEARLAPIYERLNLHAGRLELMSGIRERRLWPVGTRPSTVASRAGQLALAKSGFDRARLGTLVHASVCRDFLEPSTASVVHAALQLEPRCMAFDLSNACLGFANALTIVASQIERREIDAALVVAGEDGGPLLEATIEALNKEAGDPRGALKRAYASLTIGSGAAACVLAHSSVSRSPRRLVAAAALAATEHHGLCHGDVVAGAAGPLMETDSEALLHAGNALAARTWSEFERESGWKKSDVERVVTHQVGVAHRKLLFETLGLDPALDHPTVETLGNIGSVSLPLSFARAEDAGFVRPGQRVALLGIGSGLHCLMLAIA